MISTGKADVKVIFALTLVHFTGDIYASFLHPLLPVFVKEFALSLTQVGLLAGLGRVLAFIVQPAAGYIADHYKSRFFVLGGPLLSVLFMPLVGLANGFYLLLVFIALGSIGQSMFHPPAAGMVSSYSGPHFGLSMSIFNMGGTLAFGVGPLFISYVVQSYGLRASPWTMIAGIPLMVLLFKLVPVPEGEALGELGFFGSMREAFGDVWRAIILIWCVVVLRTLVGQSFLTFATVMYGREGYSLIAIGTVVSAFTVAGAISGIFAGHLSDRFGYKPVFILCHTLSMPSLYLLLILPGKWVYLGALLGGFFVMATMPLGVAWAQELAPKGKSMVSSLMMGLAFGTGGLLTPVIGKLADIYSIRTVLSVLTLIPLLTIAFIYLVPERKKTGSDLSI